MIQRYELALEFGDLVYDGNGNYVLFTEHEKIVKELVAALKFNRNEMSYRLYQIKDGIETGYFEIRMYGEMVKAIELADQVLARLEPTTKDVT